MHSEHHKEQHKKQEEEHKIHYLWKYLCDLPNQGCIQGLFVATQEDIDNALGETIYFSGIWGKHSEVFLTFFEAHIDRMDVSQQAIAEITKVLGDTWSGHNPLDYIEPKKVEENLDNEDDILEDEETSDEEVSDEETSDEDEDEEMSETSDEDE